jgi:5'-AMP-activated protein kinase, regulatory gamma subunit
MRESQNLARERSYGNLDIPVKEALAHREVRLRSSIMPFADTAQLCEGVHTCRASDSLALVVDTIVRAAVHRLIIVDDARHVIGVVSLSDILSFLTL